MTDFRVNDIAIPVVLRAEGEQRTNIDRVRTLDVGVVGKAAVPLLQVARTSDRHGFAPDSPRSVRLVGEGDAP
ncbi:MAG: hypothetical protein HOI95_25015 [Chromatiales bacterium]|nr:hypothetical protein [Chromatiales bacterium]